MYGLPATPGDYLSLCGYLLNAERAEARIAWRTVTAVKIANGQMEIPLEWSQYLTDSPEEADDFRRRLTQAALRTMRPGG